MTLFDAGAGTPIVVVPGMTGRWEWIEPALRALAMHGRAIGFSLRGEAGSGFVLPEDAAFDSHVEQLDVVLDRAGVAAAVLCGVSFGGWVALRYAARRPQRVLGLVLASSPGPSFAPDAGQRRYLRRPVALAPLFVATAPLRLGPEIRMALPRWRDRWRYSREQLWRIVRAPMSPRLMARRIEGALKEEYMQDCTRVLAPTLVLTGEPGLDRVVPVGSSREYLRTIRGAVHAAVPGTGHLGVATRPEQWAGVIGAFVRGLEPGARQAEGR